jgi:uncharacterized membrane protein YdjX (TVP38/TMEM64 family)
MNTNFSILRHPFVKLGIVCGLLTILVIPLVYLSADFSLEHLWNIWLYLQVAMLRHPVVLFLALVILPSLPIPTSALYFTTGVIWREHPVMACCLSLSSMILNLSWTYWLASGPARRVVQKLLIKTRYILPSLEADGQLRLVLILKLTPGIPFFIQNYIAGFIRVPFKSYMGLSLLINGIFVIGIVLSGVGIGGKNFLPALTGLSLIALSAVLVVIIREYLRKN